jgi:hypothetical protein
MAEEMYVQKVMLVSFTSLIVLTALVFLAFGWLVF